MVTQFGDLSTSAGLEKLDEYLLTRSYIEGFKASKADVNVLNQLIANVSKNDYPNAYRWFKHITSFSDASMASWEGQVVEAAVAKTAAKEEGDDDFDFSDDSDEDDDTTDIIAKKKAEAEASKKSTAPSGKSSIIMDVKPWGLEVDMAELERLVRAIELDGLRWAGSQLEEVAFGVRKLRINCVVVDDLVGTDDLQEAIEALEDHVQSTDIYAFNKL